MHKPKRVKRATAEDIYAKGCVHGGYCPTDVKNKVENNTWADWLLKFFGSVAYFGNLGIGTGRGTGGTLGYRPLGGATGPKTPTTVRPIVPLDPIGPTDIIPVNVLEPTAPSIVPLNEGLPETAVIDIGGSSPGLGTDNSNVITVIDPLSEVTGLGEHPNIITTDTESPAILDIQTSPPPPKRVAISRSFEETVTDITTHFSHVDPNVNMYADPLGIGQHVGFSEEIPLQELNVREEFDIEEGPSTSTPISSRLSNRVRDLYSRYVVQAPTRPADLAVLTSRATQFEFENPAFESDITLTFENDLAEMAQINASSNTSLPTVRTLSRPRLSETPGRSVRVSRLGQKAGMKTRSGLEIGQRVHLYYDISRIQEEAIELNTFGEYSHDSTIVDELTTSTFINPFEQPVNELFTDMELLDPLEENFSNTQIIVPYLQDEESLSLIPVLPPSIAINVYTDTAVADLFVHHPISATSIIIPDSPYVPINPYNGLETVYEDYELHPSLRRKRKRMHSSF